MLIRRVVYARVTVGVYESTNKCHLRRTIYMVEFFVHLLRLSFNALDVFFRFNIKFKLKGLFFSLVKKRYD